MPTHPEVLWAQRSSETDEEKNIIYLTVNLPDIDQSTLDYSLTGTEFKFKTKAGVDQPREYECDLVFFDEIDPEKSSKKISSRALDLKLQKKTLKEEYWPRLTKDKNRFVKTNFDKWVDEDEQDPSVQEKDDDYEGMGGMGGMPGMGGMGGMGGMPGMGGPGGMDIEAMMEQLKSSGGMPDLGEGSGSGAPDAGGDDESDDEGPPPLEDAEPST
ncbi:hypothetical protein NP233_g515 [Leucocoprinus birnbaumii]|uniref:CS domain-containing protein n=1 Tax=Leucocoprinus birnbaumii TaxID=56174 RepID=A0AAD5Z068_9AGAR|nr:hypothetical protein NP233_g515 [Leucocoprinus birnbaumii]